MRTKPIQPETDNQGVFAVPPLARRHDAKRSLNWDESAKLVRHIHDGGITRLLYGGNAFLYHLSLAEYEQLLDWLASFDDALWALPSAGPSFGRLMDQAPMLKRYNFPCVMALPCSDPRDAAGLETGLREFADAAATPLMLYLKEENNFGADRERGLDAVARMVNDGVCVAIKYAVVRQDPAHDPYLSALLQRVDRKYVISGIGERPAVVHMRDWKLPGFTTGSGCISPSMTTALFEACRQGKFAEANGIRECFLPLEDIRDELGPARVLHAACEAAGIMKSGPIPPFISRLTNDHYRTVAERAPELAEAALVR